MWGSVTSVADGTLLSSLPCPIVYPESGGTSWHMEARASRNPRCANRRVFFFSTARRFCFPERVVDYGVKLRTVHGYRRAFVHTGRGPALLFLHGIGDRHDTWRPLIPNLARDHTVIAPDLLGHGRSDKPRGDYSVGGYANAMRDLLTILGVERVTVIGHSLGGGIAMQFAYQYPERCERVVLVATGGVGREVHPILRLAA